jgi:hypothetical protein
MTEQNLNFLPLAIIFIVTVIAFIVHGFLLYKDHSKTDKHCETLIELVILSTLWGEFHKREMPFLKSNQIAEFLYELEEIFYKRA